MPFTFEPLDISDVVLVTPKRHPDARGFFQEVYRAEEFQAAGIEADFVQDNLTHSVKNALRGLHYQLPPAAQGKLIGPVQGTIFDVAVDLRTDGSTYGRWVGRVIDAQAGEFLWIPPGFAHGYCILSDTADVLYKVTDFYAADLNRGIAWDDPTLAIEWPVDDPILSEADTRQPSFDECDNPFRLA